MLPILFLMVSSIYANLVYTNHEITGMIIGTPCDANGQDLPPDTEPAPPQPKEGGTWHPFKSRAHFELADFIFRRNEMAGEQVDDLMHILASMDEEGQPPFAGQDDVYKSIDRIAEKDEWSSLTLWHADGDGVAEGEDTRTLPTWKQAKYDLWLRDAKKVVQAQISNPELKDHMDYAPRQVFGNKHQRVWSDFMSGNWAWDQCVSTFHFQLL